MSSPLTDWERYEPAAVKAVLPLEWAIGDLFGAWGAGEAMMPCPLPGHQDDTPSFNLWAPDDDGRPMRFGCFGCGRNGDVIDAIREARGVDFLEACRIAVEEMLPRFEVADWDPTANIERAPAASPDMLMAYMTALVADHGDDVALQKFLERKGLEVPAQYARDWRWRGVRNPNLLLAIPHFDWDGRMTGIRYRPSLRDAAKWTERGSRFDALYGAWRDQGRERVLLCEGETDTLFAAYSLHSPPWNIDVMGLPSGAAQKPGGEAVARLAGRVVMLAFDGDMAGRIATNRWRTALDGVADVRPVPIPDGEDICSLGALFTDLLPEVQT
jgi:hypothetical protein